MNLSSGIITPAALPRACRHDAIARQIFTTLMDNAIAEVRMSNALYAQNIDV